MIILDKHDKIMAINQLDELRNEMLGKLEEIQNIIHELAGDNRMIWERAKAYWYTSIENNLSSESGSFLGSMVNFEDTLNELKEMVGDGDEEDDPESYFDKER